MEAAIKSETIREVRRRLGITQRQLGECLNVDQGTVSRWERGVEHPRPAREAKLRALVVRDEDRRHLNRSMALVRNDFLPATLLDARLRLVELSASAGRFFRARGRDPSNMLGMSFERYQDRIGMPELVDYVRQSGLLTGDALLFRFTVNACGKGNTTAWEPIFEGGELKGVLNYVAASFAFPENTDFSLELVEFVPTAKPESRVVLHRGKRFDLPLA